MSRAAIEVDLDGVIFCLDTRDLVDFRLLYRGLHQPDLVSYLTARLAARSAVFWDVGANVGAIALRIAANTLEAPIYAFEPSPPVFTRLSANVAKNPTLQSRIKLYQVALTDESGKSEFFVSNEASNSGVGGLKAAHNRMSKSVTVSASRGDDLIREHEIAAPTLIKIDVEGFELDVLRGLERHLQTAPDVEVVFEHEPYRLRDRGLEPRATIEYLEQIGFAVSRIAEPKTGRTASLDATSLKHSCDLVARKRA